MFLGRFLIAVSLVALVSLAVPSFAEKAETPVNISNSEKESKRPQIQVSENEVFIAYQDKTYGKDEVFFVRSIEEGKKFLNPVNISNNNGSSPFPRILVDDSKVFVTWYDYSPGQSDVFFSKSDDGGKTFENKLNLSDNISASFNPWIAKSKNNLYVVWNDGGWSEVVDFGNGDKRIIDVITGQMDIILAKSRDGGESFDTINITNTTTRSWNPRIAAQGSNIYIVWNESGQKTTDIYFSMSIDGGDLFSRPINISKSQSSSEDAAIKAKGPDVYMIWQEKHKDSTDILFAKSIDNGITFSEPLKLNKKDGNFMISRDTQLLVSDRNIFTVWYDQTNNTSSRGVYFVKSTDGGESFEKPVRLTSGANSKFAQITNYKNNLFVLWQDSSLGREEVFLKASQDSGESFGDKINISQDPRDSRVFILGPQIQAVGTKAYVVWENLNFDGGDLYFKKVSPFHEQQPKSSANLDERARIELSFDKLEDSEPQKIMIEFYDRQTGSLLGGVVYTISVVDMNEDTVFNESSSTKTGKDTQRIIFEEKGEYKIKVEVSEAENNKNITGTTEVLVKVIPEFPVGVFFVIILGISLVVVYTKKNIVYQTITN